MRKLTLIHAENPTNKTKFSLINLDHDQDWSLPTIVAIVFKRPNLVTGCITILCVCENDINMLYMRFLYIRTLAPSRKTQESYRNSNKTYCPSNAHLSARRFWDKLNKNITRTPEIAACRQKSWFYYCPSWILTFGNRNSVWFAESLFFCMNMGGILSAPCSLLLFVQHDFPLGLLWVLVYSNDWTA